MEIQLTLPDDIALGLKIPPQAIEESILKEIAFLFYAQGKASLGIAEGFPAWARENSSQN